MSFFDIIGLLGTGLGILQAVPSFLQNDNPIYGVRVTAGLSNITSESPGGNVPGVAMWDANGDLIAWQDGSDQKVVSGSFHDIVLHGDGRPVEYLAISNGGNDGLCIAGVGVTNANGIQQGWVGDIGKMCGAPWYHQTEQLGTPEGSAAVYRPACVWIDRDGSNGHSYQGFSMHINDFSISKDTSARAQQFTDNPATLCNSVPRFTMWHKMVTENTVPVFAWEPTYNDDGTDNDTNLIIHPQTKQASGAEALTPAFAPPTSGLGQSPAPLTNPNSGSWAQASGPSALENLKPQQSTRRRKRQISNNMPSHLVISAIDSHSARELCESGTSVGPDFVSTAESLFCDMSEKQLYPLCSDSIANGCFNMDTNTVKPFGKLSSSNDTSATGNWTGPTIGGVVNIVTPQSSYISVHNWS